MLSINKHVARLFRRLFFGYARVKSQFQLDYIDKSFLAGIGLGATYIYIKTFGFLLLIILAGISFNRWGIQRERIGYLFRYRYRRTGPDLLTGGAFSSKAPF